MPNSFAVSQKERENNQIQLLVVVFFHYSTDRMQSNDAK